MFKSHLHKCANLALIYDISRYMLVHEVLFEEYVILFSRIDLQNPLCAKLAPAGMADSGKSSYSRSTVGPVGLSMCAFFHFSPGLKFFIRTLSPSANCHSFPVLSCCPFCKSCWVSTRCLTSGRMRSKWVHRRRLNKSSAGVTPVVV